MLSAGAMYINDGFTNTQYRNFYSVHFTYRLYSIIQIITVRRTNAHRFDEYRRRIGIHVNASFTNTNVLLKFYFHCRSFQYGIIQVIVVLKEIKYE